MYGRYGGDQLNVFLLVLYLIFYFISIWTNFLPLYWLSLVVIVWGLFRMLSRNLPRRWAENAKFMQLAGPAINWFHLRRTMHRDKEHRYFRCPSCGQQLRVPKGKGKITDLLAEASDVVIRFQGGANAGHTIINAVLPNSS